MSEENNVLEYDEEDSIRFIQEHLPDEMKGKFTDDEINYVVDLIYEYYEEKGFLDEDEDEDEDEDAEVEIDEDELLAYVIDSANRDAIRDFSEEEIEAIVAGELAYCDSLNLFF
jgi:hypothetical protein